MSKFRKSLEERTNEVLAGPTKTLWENTIPGILRREIALTKDQIKRFQQIHNDQFRRLLSLECYINTELMQLEPPYTLDIPRSIPEKQKLKQRLLGIDKERRNLSLKLEEKTQGLEAKLLDLINKHEQIK